MSIISQLKKKDYWEFSGCLMVRASHVARCKKKKKKAYQPGIPCLEKDTTSSITYHSKNVKLQSNHEVTSDKSKLTRSIKQLARIEQNVIVMKDEERLRNYCRLKESKETRQLNAICDPG